MTDPQRATILVAYSSRLGSSAGIAEFIGRVLAEQGASVDVKAVGDAIRHMGPMAQDSYAAFGLGVNEKGIDTVDADGVALAAIRGLNQKLERENAQLRQELEAPRGRRGGAYARRTGGLLRVRTGPSLEAGPALDVGDRASRARAGRAPGCMAVLSAAQSYRGPERAKR